MRPYSLSVETSVSPSLAIISALRQRLCSLRITGQWISKLKAERIFGFRLHHISRTNLRDDRLSAGFVGGGERWLIETTRVISSDFWEARWRVRNQNAPDRKTWDVKYFRVSQNRPSVSPGARGLPALRRELEDVLVNIKEFARRQNLAVFADLFQRSIELICADRPLEHVCHSDLTRGTELPLDAQEVLAAAQAAWVFGGMGSWNDLILEGSAQQEYAQRSDQLFSLLSEAICEAANSNFPINN